MIQQQGEYDTWHDMKAGGGCLIFDDKRKIPEKGTIKLFVKMVDA